MDKKVVGMRIYYGMSFDNPISKEEYENIDSEFIFKTMEALDNNIEYCSFGSSWASRVPIYEDEIN